MMWSLLLDWVSDIFKQNTKQLTLKSNHVSWMLLLLMFGFNHRWGREVHAPFLQMNQQSV